MLKAPLACSRRFIPLALLLLALISSARAQEPEAPEAEAAAPATAETEAQAQEPLTPEPVTEQAATPAPEDFMGIWALDSTLYLETDDGPEQIGEGDAQLMVTSGGVGDELAGHYEFRSGPETIQVPFASAEILSNELVVRFVAGRVEAPSISFDFIRLLLSQLARSGHLELDPEQETNMFALDPSEYGVDPTESVVFEGRFRREGDLMTGRIEVESDEDIGVLDGVYIELEGSEVAEDQMLATADQLTTAPLPTGAAAELPPAEAPPAAEVPLADEDVAGEMEGLLPEDLPEDLPEPPALPAEELTTAESELFGDEPVDAAAAEAELPLVEPAPGLAPPAAAPTDEPPIVDVPAERDAVTRTSLDVAKIIAEREQARRAAQIERVRLQRLSTYRYNLLAPTPAAAVEEAQIRALKTTAGRLYFGNYILMGRTILEPYLRRNIERFVPHTEIISRQQTEGGRQRFEIVVSVDRNVLYTDLQNKHFIDRPKFRPIMGVALEGNFGGNIAPETLPRQLIQEMLVDLDMRVEETPIFPGAAETFVAAEPDLLRRAREEAQRLDIDVIVTGTLRTTPPEPRTILFDQRFFTQARLDLQLIRVDNGEVLRTVRREVSTSQPTAQFAVNNVSQNAIESALAELTEGFLDEWRRTMLDNADYRLLILGADDRLLQSIISDLEMMSPELEVYVKATYGNAAVLNVFYPAVQSEQVVEYFRRSRAPQFRVTPSPLGRGRYEIRVL